jgi:predicted nucleotidyltransferase
MKEFGIDDKNLHLIRSIFKDFHVINKVLVYGSRAKGNYREGSDIDFTLFGTIEYDELIQLKNEFEEKTFESFRYSEASLSISCA